MKYFKIYPTSVNMRFVDETVGILRDGGMIIYPTDTLYALGCNALDSRAIGRICALKGINPDKQMLSVVCSDISQASEYALIDNRAFRLLKDNLPGPFTFILPASSNLPKVFRGRKTVGIRVPDNCIARTIAKEMGCPILSSSIDTGRMSPEEAVDPQTIAMFYENSVQAIIDGGCGGLIPSTVINCLDSSDPEVVREGKGIVK